MEDNISITAHSHSHNTLCIEKSINISRLSLNLGITFAAEEIIIWYLYKQYILISEFVVMREYCISNVPSFDD